MFVPWARHTALERIHGYLAALCMIEWPLSLQLCQKRRKDANFEFQIARREDSVDLLACLAVSGIGLGKNTFLYFVGLSRGRNTKYKM